MHLHIALRRLAATSLLLVAAAACTSRAPAPPGVLTQHGYPVDFASLAVDEDDDEAGERDRAAISAEYNLKLEADEYGPPSAAQILRAHDQRKALVLAASASALQKSAGLQPSQWQALGPSNVAGRVRSFAIDPRNQARLLAGTASGGLWTSPDNGATWHANQDFLPNLSIGAIAFDPVNPAIVYMGTGEASAGLVGLGVFKSVDAGLTWQYLSATNVDANPDWRFVNRIATHPTQSGVVLAAMTNNVRTLGAIYRSTDAGASWTRVSPFKALDIAFDPNTPSNALAGLDDGTLAYSRDGGLTWTHTAQLMAPAGRNNTARAEIAFARSQHGLAYASIDNNKGEVWRSLDSGATWELLSNPQHLNNQGDYDNAIWVDPTDANHVIVAGLDVYQSRDGGVSFAKVSDWRSWPASAHADHHALVSVPNFGPANAVLYDANDGGVYRSANVYSVATGGWSNMNSGLPTTQFYSGAGRVSAGGKIVGGTQDNGTFMLQNGLWRRYDGGDGGFVAVDPRSDNTVYNEYVYAALQRTLDGGFTLARICEGITEGLPSEGSNAYCGADATKKANFIAPFVLDPNNPDRLYAGAASLWVTDTPRATVTWRSIKAPSSVTDNFINAIAVAPGNGNTVWVGYNNGEVHRSDDASSATPSWTRIGTGVLPLRQVQRITVDQDNASHVIVAFTGFVADNIWETRDGGATWRSISGNLPFAPVFDVKRHPANPSWLYAATSVGVFTSENGGATWSTTNEGPANIRVRELFWLDNSTLVAATYGRGMWRIAVAGSPSNYQDLWWAGIQENGWGMSLTQHGATIFGAMYVYDAQGQPLWVVLPGGTWDASGTSYSGALYIPSGSWFGSYDVSRFVPNASVGNATLTFTSASTATLAYTINGVPGTKSIQRQGFGPQDTSTPMASYGDLWWGGSSQNGWGVAINQQYATLFAVWYTYDASGKTVWYVVPSGTWTAANVYSGAAYRTTGSPWIGATYNPNALNAQPVGTVTFSFTDLNNAVMTYTVDGVTGSKPLTRQPF